MAVRKGTDETGSKPAVKAVKKPAAKPAAKPTAKPVADKPATKSNGRARNGEGTIKRDTSPLRKNRTKADRDKKPTPIAEQFPPPPELYKEMGLSLQEAIFIEQYLTHFNQSRAYQEAYPSCLSYQGARANCWKLMQKPKIVAYRDRRMKAMFDRAEEEQDRLIRTYTMTAYADVNELVEYRHDCCRFCHGQGNKYQFTPAEFERHKDNHAIAVAEAMAAKEPVPEFDPQGGIGFNPNNDPSEDCPECFGRGRPTTIIKDTRFLSPAALSLYAGMKEGKDGIEIKMHSQEKAREVLAKIHKLYDDNTAVNLNFNVEELDAKFGEAMRKAHENAERMRQERLDAEE